MKNKPFFIILLLVAIAAIYFIPRYSKYRLPIPPTKISVQENSKSFAKLKAKAASLKSFCLKNNYSSSTCFLVDMSIPSGKKRFIVYDFKKDTIITSGLMAHGSCNTAYLETAKFSNTPDCGCSSLGRYAIGNKYTGKFGEAYKLYGLDSSNSNAFIRFIVLHGYSEVPDNESAQPICNSLGCPMVSHAFLSELGRQIAKSKKPILLWIFN